MSNLLRACGLEKHYGGYHAVRNVDLSVSSGETVGLLGPNGAGKTSSFYLIAGLIPADAGQILLDDRDITHAQMHERSHFGIGYLPQEASVFRRLSVVDNLLAVLELRPGMNARERRRRADLLLEELHISHLRDKLGIELSGGERRRVEIARTLAIEPRFILLDEPFAGVDPISVIDIQRIIDHLKARHIGILITDHNVRETLGICDRAYILSEGRVIAEGAPQAILENQQVKDVYLGENFAL